MLVWTTVRLALKSLAANKLRSILAMLGIIIAVWSVISALALGAGAQAKVVSQLSAMGTNLLIVQPASKGAGGVFSGRYQTLKVDDAIAMLGVDQVVAVAPVARGNAQVKYLNKNTNVSVIGTSQTYFSARDFTVRVGRALTDSDADSGARVAVIGPTAAEALFGKEFDWCIGETIAVKGVGYRVIGLTKSKGDQGWFNPDNQILVPYSTAMSQILGTDYLNEVDIRCTDGADLTKVQANLLALLSKRHRIQPGADPDVQIQNQADMVATATEFTTIFSILLGGIAGISLLVGGIGIMNIMLVTVAERTREIGIRKAIGAKQRDILRQFLIESVVMSGLGGSIGVGIAILTATLISTLQDRFQLLVQPWSIALSLGFSVGVGIFFGYYPALRAAKLDPIEALRYE